MIFDRLSVMAWLFPGPLRNAAPVVARRWRTAAAEQPELVTDLIGMGQVLALSTAEGASDPHRLAYEAGRRDLALELIALMGVRAYEINQLMEKDHVHTD
jgi:hypothetical protein